MKRLLDEGDCTMLERSLLTSIDLDVAPLGALEKLRALVARDAQTAVVPAVVREGRRTITSQRAAIGAVFGLAAGFALFLAARHNDVEVDAVRKDPSVPMKTAAPHVPVAPPPAESALEPALLFPPPPAVVRSAPSVRRPVPVPSVSHKAAPAEHEGRSASFDKGAAAQALGSVNLSDCATIEGPSGAGHVSVTFGNDGTVQSTVVDQGPFPGTARGGCVAAKFRTAVVPPFDGSPVRVGKSFTLP